MQDFGTEAIEQFAVSLDDPFDIQVTKTKILAYLENLKSNVQEILSFANKSISQQGLQISESDLQVEKTENSEGKGETELCKNE